MAKKPIETAKFAHYRVAMLMEVEDPHPRRYWAWATIMGLPAAWRGPTEAENLASFGAPEFAHVVHVPRGSDPAVILAGLKLPALTSD